MKRILKTMAFICMMVFMFGMTVSADEAVITANVVKQGTENPENFAVNSYTYGQANSVIVGSDTYYGKIIPVYVQEAGVLYIKLTDNQSISAGVQIGVLQNRNLSNSLCSAVGGGYIYEFNSAMEANNKLLALNIPSPGTYYIILNSAKNLNILTSNTISLKAYVVSNVFPTGEISVTKKNANVTYYTGHYSNAAPDQYIKYKAPANGYLTIKANSGSGYITLCNSKKKELSTKDTINATATNNKTVYGVKKGTTYYIKINTYETEFKLNLKTTGITDKSGSSKKKAKTLAVKRNMKGTIVANNKTADWYKIVLKKNSKVTYTVKGSANDQFIVTFYNNKNEKMLTQYVNGDFELTVTSVNKYNTYQRVKWTKGTYYVKIERANKQSSGYYSLKWQKK